MASMIPCSNPKLCGVQYHHPNTVTKCNAPGSVRGGPNSIPTITPASGATTSTLPGDKALDDMLQECYEEKFYEDLEEQGEVDAAYVERFIKEEAPEWYEDFLQDTASELPESDRAEFMERHGRGPDAQGATPEEVFGGKTVVITGKLSGMDRFEAEALVEKAGGNIPNNVTKNTDILVVGDKVGATKMNKAEALGIKIMKGSDFERIMNGEGGYPKPTPKVELPSSADAWDDPATRGFETDMATGDYTKGYDINGCKAVEISNDDGEPLGVLVAVDDNDSGDGSKRLAVLPGISVEQVALMDYSEISARPSLRAGVSAQTGTGTLYTDEVEGREITDSSVAGLGDLREWVAESVQNEQLDREIIFGAAYGHINDVPEHLTQESNLTKELRSFPKYGGKK